MQKHVLVTGGLGYLGGVVAPYLKERGWRVTVLDTGFFKDSVLYPQDAVSVVEKDARDIELADLEGVSAVLHFAGISNDPFGNLDEDRIYHPTREYARVIAELCKKRGIRFVFASSCSVYGKSDPARILDEDSPAHPETGYSRNKLDIEGDLRSLAGEEFSPTALRFATVFGLSPRMRFDIVINMFVGMAITEGAIVLNSDGTSWRPNVHIRDVARAIEFALGDDRRDGRLLVLNVGDDSNNRSVRDIALSVAREAGDCVVRFPDSSGASIVDELARSSLVKDGKDARTYRVSFERIKRHFPGFSCSYSIEEGAKEMVRELRAMGLSRDTFKDPKFYRLQTIEKHLVEGRIDSDLRWTTRQ